MDVFGKRSLYRLRATFRRLAFVFRPEAAAAEAEEAAATAMINSPRREAKLPIADRLCLCDDTDNRWGDSGGHEMIRRRLSLAKHPAAATEDQELAMLEVLWRPLNICPLNTA